MDSYRENVTWEQRAGERYKMLTSARRMQMGRGGATKAGEAEGMSISGKKRHVDKVRGKELVAELESLRVWISYPAATLCHIAV